MADRPPLSDDDLLLVFDATGDNLARAARITGFSRDGLIRRRLKNPLREHIAALRARLKAEGRLYVADPPTHRKLPGPATVIDEAQSLCEEDGNASVHLARIGRLAQSLCMVEFRRELGHLMDSATYRNLPKVYRLLIQRATGMQAVIDGVLTEARKGLERLGRTCRG